MNNHWFKKIILICGGIFLLSSVVIGYAFIKISQKEIKKPQEILSISNFWLGLKTKEKIEWKASNFSEIGEGLTYFFGYIESVDAERQIIEVLTYDNKKLKVKLERTVVSTILFQIPIGRNYLSLHHFHEESSSIRKKELVFIFGRKYLPQLTPEEVNEMINFFASEIVRKR